MAGNVVKICTQPGCLEYSRPTEDDVRQGAQYVESNGDTVLLADAGSCQDVCKFIGHRAVNGIAPEDGVAFCVVAGDAYDISPSLLDYMGMSGVIGRVDGEMRLGLLNQRPYPPLQA